MLPIPIAVEVKVKCVISEAKNILILVVSVTIASIANYCLILEKTNMSDEKDH